MWRYGTIGAVLVVAMLHATGADATDLSPSQAVIVALPPAPQSSDTGSSTDRIRAAVSGLRQSLADNGLSQALTRASDWVKELEVSWTAHLNGHATGGINTEADTDIEEAAATAAAAAKNVSFSSRPANLSLGLVSFGTGGTDDQVWAIGHAQPVTSLVASSSTEHNGSTTSERSLASHDVKLGLRMPMMPWDATIAGDHYWWGTRGFGPQVEGTRVALKLSPMQNVQIEGGRASDTRGTGGFVGVRYSVPLDQSK
ncbi:MAG TPA: hypothetical protein VGF92_14900 [Stellaceae bacterium]|jgi:hypothetical protein